MDRRLCKEIKTVYILTNRYVIKNNLQSSKQNNLSPVQVDIIEYLAETPQPIYQKELEEEFNLRKSTISGVLQTMEKNNLISKSEAKFDSRSKQIKLTTKGRKIYDDLVDEIIEVESTVGKDIKNKDLKVFTKVMDQIKKNLEEIDV